MNCLGCFYWRRKDIQWGVCENRQGVELEPVRATLITKEDFSCRAFSEKFRVAKYESVKVTPQEPWDQGGDVNPQKVH